MNTYAQGFVIAAIGLTAGLVIAHMTYEAPPPVVLEREVPAEIVVEAPQLLGADFHLMITAMEPVAPDFYDFCLANPDPPRKSVAYGLCKEVVSANRANQKGLDVLLQMLELDMVDFTDEPEGGYDHES